MFGGASDRAFETAKLMSQHAAQKVAIIDLKQDKIPKAAAEIQQMRVKLHTVQAVISKQQ